MNTARAILSGALLLSSTAVAAPSLIGYSGRLVDNDGVAYSGPHDFVIGIYTAATAGTPVFEESFEDVPVDEGFFYLLLANNAVVGGDDLDGVVAGHDTLYLQVEVDGTVLSPRQRIAAVPWALGQGRSARLQSIATASCDAGQVLRYDAARDTFYCDDDGLSTHTHSGADITSDTLAFDRLPTGTASGTVAAGDHTHLINVQYLDDTQSGASPAESVIICPNGGKATSGECSTVEDVDKGSYPLEANLSSAESGDAPVGWRCVCSDSGGDGECTITTRVICVSH